MEFTNSSGKVCTPQHYLVELVCIRKSKKQKIPMDSEKWWNHINWKKDYARQIALAHGLLKLFTPESIIAALNSKEGNWIFSLSFKGLAEIIKNNEVREVHKAKVAKIIDNKDLTFEEIAVQEISQIRLNKKSSIDKLKEIE
jgi:hypothetical protein